MSVVGFDVGNINCIVAIARAGGIDTVDNDYSSRVTPAVVAFNDKMRTTGVTASNQMMSNLKNTITQVKRFIGRKASDPMTKLEVSYAPFAISTDGNDNILFQVRYKDEVTMYTPVQIMGMLLQELRGTASSHLNAEATDSVISVPSFFTDSQRNALLDASKIAGLNCLRVMSETSAVALSYGLFKTDLPAAEEPPRNVAFVDMGHSALQVSICAFNKGKIKVLSVASDPSLGGRNFDWRIRDHIAEAFKVKYKLDSKSSARPWARLLVESEKLKKQMSSNTTKLPLNIECFMDDKDVSYSLDRATMEEFSADLFARVEAPLQTALTDSGLKLEDVQVVEIVGGSSRLPGVKQTIERVFGKPISTTLNADEAVARGCAIQCAMLSHTIRVRDIEVQDACSYPIHISWDSTKNDETGQMEIFNKYHNFPATKMLTLQRKEPFQLRAYYHDNTPVPIVDKRIGEFLVKDVMPTADGEPSKVKVKVRLNTHGCFTIHSATLVEKLATPPPSPTKEEPKEELSFPMATGDTAPAEPTEGEKTENPMETDTQPTDPDTAVPPPADDAAAAPDATAENKENATDASKEADKKDAAPPSTPEQKKEDTKASKKKKNIKNHDLGVESFQDKLNTLQLADLQRIEKELVENIKLTKLIADSKNAVEEYIYTIREELDGKYEGYATSEAVEKFQRVLMDTEDWLYDDGEDCERQVYQDKLGELQTYGDPIHDRYYLHTELPRSFELLGATMMKYRKIVDAFSNGDELYDHIDKKDMDSVAKRLDEKFNWLNQNLTKFQNTKKFQKPDVKASDVQTETTMLVNFCDPIVNKKKPKVEPPKDDVKPDATAAADASKDNAEKPMDTDPAAAAPTATDAPAPAGDAPPPQTNPNLDMEVD